MAVFLNATLYKTLLNEVSKGADYTPQWMSYLYCVCIDESIHESAEIEFLGESIWFTDVFEIWFRSDFCKFRTIWFNL